jgi:lipoate-protein ligase A
MPSDYEITVGRRKLVGSAQMRAQGVVLQHGAMPLYGDIARICPLLASHPDPTRVRARAVAVDEVLGRPVSWDEAAGALAAGFAEALNLVLAPDALTAEELAEAQALRTEKYATAQWTDLL